MQHTITSADFDYAVKFAPSEADQDAICAEMRRRVDKLDQETRALLYETLIDSEKSTSLIFAHVHHCMGIATPISEQLSDAYQHIRQAGKDLEPDDWDNINHICSISVWRKR